MPSPHPPPFPLPADDPLPEHAPEIGTIVEALAKAHVGADSATLVRIELHDDEMSLAVNQLPPGTHPSDALLGEVVPVEWDAAGLASPATARCLDDDQRAERHVEVERIPVGFAIVIDRAGNVFHHLAGPDAPTIDAGPLDAPSGALRDLIERNLDLPTDPPEQGPASWWRRLWLDRLVSAAADGGPEPPGARPAPWPPELWRALVDEPGYCDDGGWERLRLLAAGPSEPLEPAPNAVRRALTPFVDRSLAAWFDEGAFSRWLLAALPPEDDLLDALESMVDTDTARMVRSAIEPTDHDHGS